MERVGIRELRGNLRHYLQRATAGDAFVVTDYGRPLARLGPLPTSSSRLARLVADGRVTPARKSVASLPHPLRAASGQSATEALLAERNADPR